MKHRNPTPTVDAILQKGSKVLLIRRRSEPFMGYLALPGGFVNEGETVEEAMKREVKEETSLEVEPIEILGVYSDPKRDPRWHVITVAFVGIIVGEGKVQANDDAVGADWVELDRIEDMNERIAFDHVRILLDYRTWKRSMGTFWSTKRRIC